MELNQLKAALVKQSDKDEELDMFREEVQRLKQIINTLTQQNELLTNQLDTKASYSTGDAAADQEKIALALKSKERLVEALQRKLK